MILKIKRLSEDIIMPEYKHDGDSGMDLRAYGYFEGKERYYFEKSHTIYPFQTVIFASGIFPEIEIGCELQIRPRSGLSSQGILCHFGTIDSNYRGEIGIILTNLSLREVKINKFDRIAQAVLMKVERAEIENVTVLSETVRGTNGFGSTGIK